jgi:hypothetical protein
VSRRHITGSTTRAAWCSSGVQHSGNRDATVSSRTGTAGEPVQSTTGANQICSVSIQFVAALSGRYQPEELQSKGRGWSEVRGAAPHPFVSGGTQIWWGRGSEDDPRRPVLLLHYQRNSIRKLDQNS